MQTAKPIGPLKGGLLDVGKFEMPTAYGVFKLSSLCTTSVCLGLPTPNEISEKLDEKHTLVYYKACACNRKRQRGATLCGPVTNVTWVCRQCNCNVLNALINRHGATQPEMTLDKALLVDVAKRYKNRLRASYYAYQLTKPRWYARWNLAKRLKFKRAIRVGRRRWHHCKAHIKRECMHKRVKKAREIHAYRDLAVQEYFAVTTARLQKGLAAVWSLFPPAYCGIYPTFACGLKADQIGAWLMIARQRYGRLRFYERDMANFDACNREEHFAVKEVLYSVAGEEFVNKIRKTYNKTCIATTGKGKQFSKVVYKLKGTVASGHNDTSLGNSITNGCVTLAAMKIAGYEGMALVMGDDLLVASPDDVDLTKLRWAESAFGFKPEARVFTHYAHTSFASGAFYPTTSGFMFAPKPGRLMDRFMWSCGNITDNLVDTWRRANATGLLMVCKGLPILGPWLTQYLHKGSEATKEQLKEWFEHDFEQFKVGTTVEYHPRIYQFFALKYGVTVAEIREVEEILVMNAFEAVLLRHPVMDRIRSVDNGDLDARPNWPMYPF